MKFGQKACSVLLVAGLGLFGLFQLVKPSRDFSDTERRPLAQRPRFSLSAWLDGSFSKDAGKFLADQVTGREQWLALKAEAQFRAGQGDNGRVYFAKGHHFIEYHPSLDLKHLKRNVNDLVTFAKETFHPKKGARMTLLLAPTLAGVSPGLLPANAPEANQDAILRILREEAEAGGLAAPDLLSALRAKAGGDRQLYFRTDHHWTQDGAEIAWEVWREASGFGRDKVPQYKRELKSETFEGTTYAKAPCFSAVPDPIISYEADFLNHVRIFDEKGQEVREGVYNPPALKSYDEYTYFVGENKPFLRFETGAGTGRSLLIFKDSYANALLPFLCAHYDTITMVDLRYTNEKMSDLMAKGPYDDLLFVYNVVTMAEDNNTFKLLNG